MAQLTDRIYQAARAVLEGAREALTEAGLDPPCTSWIEIGGASITPVGACACDALVIVIRERIPKPSSTGEPLRSPTTAIRVDLVLSHQAILAVDGAGVPQTMPYTGDEDGSNCATLNGLALRFSREVEALDRNLQKRYCCHVESCWDLTTTYESFTVQGICRRYTRTVEVRL